VEGASSRERHNPKDAERGAGEEAPGKEQKNGHSAAEPAEAGAAPKTVPKSLEEVLHRKQEAEEEAARPKFLSRKERERAALER
jgi:hypothetical protein